MYYRNVVQYGENRTFYCFIFWHYLFVLIKIIIKWIIPFTITYQHQIPKNKEARIYWKEIFPLQLRLIIPNTCVYYFYQFFLFYCLLFLSIRFYNFYYLSIIIFKKEIWMGLYDISFEILNQYWVFEFR